MAAKRPTPLEQLRSAAVQAAAAQKALIAATNALAAAIKQLQGLGDASLGTEPLGD